jgi:hypothetical protein
MAPTASPTRSPISTPGAARTREVRPRPQIRNAAAQSVAAQLVAVA